MSETLPWVTFTDPEAARVGLTESAARVGLTESAAREPWGDRVIVLESDYAPLDRAITAGEASGFAKLVADPRGRLGAATVGTGRIELRYRLSSLLHATGLHVERRDEVLAAPCSHYSGTAPHPPSRAACGLGIRFG